MGNCCGFRTVSTKNKQCGCNLMYMNAFTKKFLDISFVFLQNFLNMLFSSGLFCRNLHFHPTHFSHMTKINFFSILFIFLYLLTSTVKFKRILYKIFTIWNYKVSLNKSGCTEKAVFHWYLLFCSTT